MGHHALPRLVGVGKEVWDLVQGHVDLTDGRGVVNAGDGPAIVLGDVYTCLHQSED